MSDEEIIQLLSNIDKKQDKILRIVTVIAKALHLMPVSEKEERDIVLIQRKNAAVMQKIQEEMAMYEEKPKDETNTLSFEKIMNETKAEVYSDVIGSDIIS